LTGLDHPIAALTEVSKRYGGVQALDNASFSVGRGEVRALIGKNGAGKSTLIRMLAGAETPDHGSVVLSGQRIERGSVNRAFELGVRTVYQELSLIPQMTVAENLFMGEWPRRFGVIDRQRMRDEARRALDRLELEIDPGVPVEALPIADQQLVEIARAIKDEPALLILDEPTSSLASAEVERVMATIRAIKRTGVAVIYVSHRLDEIRRIADSTTIIRDGRVVATSPVAGLSTAGVVQLMLGTQASAVEKAPAPGSTVMTVRNVTLEPKLTDVSLDLREGEVLGIAGLLGSGRSELLQVMAGLQRPDSGTVTVDGKRIDGRGLRRAMRVGIGITPEDRKTDGVVPDLGVDENIVLTDWDAVCRAGVVSKSSLQRAVRAVIGSMSIKVASPRDAISTLSGGNQQKVVIGRWLHAGSRILLLDEPTRGVDVEAKAQIYALLRELVVMGKAVVFVSSEIEELNLVCDRALVLAGGQVVAEQLAPDIETDRLLMAAMGGRTPVETHA
jgi:ABC-type sugar transport system ATPase subunit